MFSNKSTLKQQLELSLPDFSYALQKEAALEEQMYLSAVAG